MLPKIKTIKPLDDYVLYVVFDDGKRVLYDVKEDIENIPTYSDLQTIPALFDHVNVDESRTCIYWNEYIDLPSDTLYECGKEISINTKYSKDDNAFIVEIPELPGCMADLQTEEEAMANSDIVIAEWLETAHARDNKKINQ